MTTNPGIVIGGIVFALAANAHAQLPAGASARLRLVVEARQLGPVAYRDPVGVMSPDGQWLAYASEGRLQLTHVAGGAVRVLGTADRGIAIAWQADSRHVAASQLDSTGNRAWWQFDVGTGDRRPVWAGAFPNRANGASSGAVDPNQFSEIAWSRDGA